MAVLGTFGSYSAARLGIYAAQAAMNVTGNNIGNINTTGYTRQRVEQSSMYDIGTPRYQNNYNINIGYGAMVTNVSQLRDPFLDIRFRNENASLGYNESMKNGLDQISHILDEVGKGEDDFGVIEAQLGDFKNALRDLLEHPDSDTHDDLVRSSASTLCAMLNTAAKELQQVKTSEEARMEESVKDINSILNNIRELNEQIRTQSVYGGNALELRDARNVQIDNLSKYMKINVTYSMEYIDGGTEIEKLSISIAGSRDPNSVEGNKPIYLIDGIFGTQLELSGMRKPSDDDPKKPDEDNIVYGIRRKGEPGYPALPSRELGKGEEGKMLAINPDFDPTVTDQTDTIHYCRYLDKDGNPTDTIGDAALIKSSVKDNDDNQYIFSLTALTDKRGFVKNAGAEVEPNLESVPVQLGDNTLYGSLQALRELLTEEGEFASNMDVALDPNASVKRGIPYYQHMLDSFAKKFAEVWNMENQDDPTKVYEMSGNNFVDAADPTGATLIQYTRKDGTTRPVINTDTEQPDRDDYPTEDDYQDAVYNYQAAMNALKTSGKLKEEYRFYDGGALFSNSGDNDDASYITAMNIAVSHSWAHGKTRVLNTKEPNTKYIDENGEEKIHDGKTRNDNLAHFMSRMEQQLKYIAKETVPDAVDTGKEFYEGTFQQMFNKSSSTLATDSKTTNALYSQYNLTALNLDNDRISVSGVDLNEEATNMMQYSQAFSAACTLLTTIDAMLDKLINNTI